MFEKKLPFYWFKAQPTRPNPRPRRGRILNPGSKIFTPWYIYFDGFDKERNIKTTHQSLNTTSVENFPTSTFPSFFIFFNSSIWDLESCL